MALSYRLAGLGLKGTPLPTFRVGLTGDDSTGPARRPVPAVPGGLAPGYDPYSTLPQAIVPTVVRPAGLFYQGGNGRLPLPNQPYVPVSGGSPPPDPLRQAVDGATNPAANSAPVPDPLRQAADRAVSPHAGSSEPPTLNYGHIVGALVGGLMGSAFGGGIGSPFTGPIGATLGGLIGGVAPGVMKGPAGESLGAAAAAGMLPGGM